MELESRLQGKCIVYLKSKGYYVIKLIQTNKNGIPDLLCFRWDIGKNIKETLMIEVKKEGEKPGPLQRARHIELMSYGVKTIVIDNIIELKKQVK